MNDTPLPLIVSAMSTFGRSVTRSNRAKISFTARRSWPSARATSQPNARNLSSIGPRSLTADTAESDCSLL